MNKKLDAALCRDFPNLYRDRHGDPRQTLMCFGFEVMDGWEPIIRRLSEKLEAMIVALPDPVTESAGTCKFGDYPEHTPEKPAASQVKSKFGALRFYMTCQTDEMTEAIAEAEKESITTCECCGKPGVLRSGGWLTVRCDVCESAKEHINARREAESMVEVERERFMRACDAIDALFSWPCRACDGLNEHKTTCIVGRTLKRRDALKRGE